MSTVYPLDITGVLPANLITNEEQPISAVNYKDFAFLIPRFAPFYATSMQITYRDLNGNVRPMVEGVDFLFAMPFVGASRATALPIYGGVQFMDLSLNGTITFTRYQTLGGNYTLDQTTLTAIMVDLIYNPRVTTWEQIANVPDVFPPVPHAWDLIDLVGMKEVDASLRAIVEAILKSINNGQNDHFTNYFNPHQVDKGDVDLALVENYPPATLSQAIEGTSATAYMTPMVANLALSTLLVPIVTDVASLSVNVSDLNARMSTAETNITGLSTSLVSLSTSASTTAVSLSTGLASAITLLQTADAGLQTQVTSLSTALVTVNNKVTSISTAQGVTNSAVQSQIAALQVQRNADVTSLQSQITNVYNTIQGQLATQSGRLDTLEARCNNFDNFLALGNLIPTIFNNVDCALWNATVLRCATGPTAGPGPVGGPTGGGE